MTDQQLYELALKAAERTYSPYSKFGVGAAILTAEGVVYTGCNIENASYGATVCAERVALFKAVSEGERAFAKIAVATLSGGDCPPCGICRQCLAEFSPGMTVIYMRGGRLTERPLRELLADFFAL